MDGHRSRFCFARRRRMYAGHVDAQRMAIPRPQIIGVSLPAPDAGSSSVPVGSFMAEDRRARP
jgi:hypothetical protein